MFVHHALNYFFIIFHSALILFNVFGWLFPKLRKWNLITQMLTAFSWFVLGIWYGWGYCPCTDWHWEVRNELGYYDMSWSYNQFLIQKLTGINFSVELVNTVTLVVFLASLTLSIILNVKDYHRKRAKTN